MASKPAKTWCHRPSDVKELAAIANREAKLCGRNTS